MPFKFFFLGGGCIFFVHINLAFWVISSSTKCLCAATAVFNWFTEFFGFYEKLVFANNFVKFKKLEKIGCEKGHHGDVFGTESQERT